MPIGQSIAGAFAGTYSGVPVSHTKNGFEFEFTTGGDEIRESDLYGDSLLDWVYRGGTHYLNFDAWVYAAGSVAAFWPWGTIGILATAAAPIGRLASNVAAPTVLTGVANTPTVVADSPASITALKSILAPNYPLKLLYSSKVRNVPVRLACLPVETGGTVTAFTST